MNDDNMDYDDDNDADMMDNNSKRQENKSRRGSRLSDQVGDMDDEPALQGYERYVEHRSLAREYENGYIAFVRA